MLGSIFRNYKNAGVRVNISLCVQRDAASKKFSPLFVHGGTGLEIHRLASSAHRDLLRQAQSSAISRDRTEKFEDTAWKVATSSLVNALPQLRIKPAAEVSMVVPYTCFIAEYLSLVYRDGEERDVCISANREVFINSFAGLHTASKSLGCYLSLPDAAA